MNGIITYLSSAARYRSLSLAVRYAFAWLIAAWALLLFWGMADYLFTLTLWFRRLYYAAAAITGAGCLAGFIRAARPGDSATGRAIALLQRAIPGLGDRLLSAWQLSLRRPEGVSAELTDAFIGSVERDLRPHKPSRIISPRQTFTRPLLLTAALLVITFSLAFLPPRPLESPLRRVLSSFFASRWNSWFSVDPGTDSFPWGTSVRITLRQARPFPGNPVLEVRGNDGRWRAAPLSREPDGSFTHAVDRLTSPIQYAAAWGDWETGVFTLTPLTFPQLGEFALTYRYPAYTRLPPRAVEGIPHLACLPGTRVTLKARSSKPLRAAGIVTGRGQRYPATVNGTSLEALFPVRENGSYRIVAEAEDGTLDPEPPAYTVSAGQDASPEIELLSPKDDLVVSPGSQLPLVVQVHDDYGLSRVDLVHRTDDDASVRTTIAQFAPGTFERLFEHPWDLAGLEIPPGRKISYYLEVWDNDTVSGPKSSVTPAKTIETTDYKKEHERIEAGLKSFREELLALLADQTGAREELRPLETAFSSAAYARALETQANAGRQAAEPSRMLKDLLSRMASDPYTDSSTHAEYRGMLTHLEHIRDGLIPEASRALARQQWQEAARAQEEIIAGLEKMSLLAEDVWEYQRMRDLLDAASDLEKTGSRLSDQVANGAAPEALKKTLDRIDELLGRISEQVSKLPHELPEDFVNSPAVKQLDMQSARDMAGSLSEAIDRGDWARARELAEQLERQLQSLMQTMQDAGQEIGFSGSAAGKLGSEIDRYKAELGRIAARQESIVEETERLDGVRRQALFRRQEDLLAQLARRQEEIVGLTERLQPGLNVRLPAFLWNSERYLGLMRKVLDEFRGKRVFHSQKYLEDIIRHWEDVGAAFGQRRTEHPQEDSRLGEELGSVLAGEREVLSSLRQPAPDTLFGAQEERQLDRARSDETATEQQTGALRHDMEEFMRRSAAVDPATFESLDAARREMLDTAGRLSGRDTPLALESARRALEHLRNGQRGLEAAGEQLSKQGKGSGQPMAGTVQVRPGGSSGFQSAPVALPRIDAYRPPREFRQEILESLREKYPAQYEKLIKDYFRKLTE